MPRVQSSLTAVGVCVTLLDMSGHYGARIRAIRCRLGMDQSGLAERMGVHKSKLCRIELGRQTCSAEMLEAAARALGVEVGDLCAEAA